MKQNEIDFLPKYEFPHKMLTNITAKSTFIFARTDRGAPDGNRFLDPLHSAIDAQGQAPACKVRGSAAAPVGREGQALEHRRGGPGPQ